PYLFGIAFRIFSAYRRKRSRERLLSALDVNDTRPSPDEVLQTKETHALLLAALERIPLPRRAVLVMHDVDEIPVREVASQLKIPFFTVDWRLRKARRELEAAVRRTLRSAAVA